MRAMRLTLGFCLLLNCLGAKAQEATRIRDELVGKLRADFKDEEGASWFLTRVHLKGDWLLDTPRAYQSHVSQFPLAVTCAPGAADCDPEFGLKLCSQDRDCSERHGQCRAFTPSAKQPSEAPKKLCVGPADVFAERIYDVIVSAEHRVDLASLSLPTGRFRTALRNALAYLSHKKNPPSVRLLFGGADPAALNLRQSPEEALAELKQEVQAVSPGGALKVRLAWLSSLPASWNHAKIVVADGERAIIGGHNMWDKDYLGATPVHDLSLDARGGAAAAAASFTNLLWSMRSIDAAGDDVENFKVAVPSHLDPAAGEDTALAVGSLGGIFGSQPSSTTLIAMLDAAQHSIVLSQQDLYNRTVGITTEGSAVAALGRAVARGVKLYVIESREGGNGTYGLVSPETSLAGVMEQAKAAAPNIHPKLLCQRVQWTRFSYQGSGLWPNGTPIGSHDKFVMVDNAAFYIGSENLYPAPLMEFGLIVFSEQRTREVLDTYVSPLWKASWPQRLPCPE